MAVFRKQVEEELSFKKIVLIFTAICLFMGVGCYQYYGQVQRTIKEENEHYLNEISSRICNNITKTLVDNFSFLDTLSSVMMNANASTFSDIGPLMQQQKEHWNYENAMLIDSSGVAYDVNGNKVSITGDSFLRSLSSEERSVFPAQLINNKESIVFTVPLKGITLDGKNMIAFATSYDPKQFDEILSMTSFNEQSFSQIVDKNGAIVIRSTSPYADSFGYNILKTITETNADSQQDITNLKADMIEDISGQYEFSVDGTKQYLIYTPIDSQEWYLYTFVPVSVVNEKSNLLLQTTLLMSFFVVFMFAALIIFVVYSFNRHRRRLEHMAYVDPITNGHTIQRFFDLAGHQLEDVTQHYTIVFTNIQRFKLLNDQFGRLFCDQVLIQMHEAIAQELREGEVVGHYSADNFCVMIKDEDKDVIVKRLEKWYTSTLELLKQKNETFPAFTIEYGVYLIEDHQMDMQDMVDRARLALRESMEKTAFNDNVFYSFYDEEVRHRLIREKHLEDVMDAALHDGEFLVYLQPKYLIKEDRIAGAEALVRWCSKSEGMIYPDAFIPLFEKNGFIIKLDLWMFEQVCKLLQKWIDMGREPVKISVNCSRAHLKDPNFLDAYKAVFAKYNVPARYLELELTENMVFEDTEHLAKVIDDIHGMGFGCSMDDFGSGYSSLNLLQNIHVDTLKLDRIFFRSNFEREPRNEAIIDCILQMAQSLSMATVAEGVEIQDQVKVLRALGCDYIQGYAYAKPMPVEDFEHLLYQDLGE